MTEHDDSPLVDYLYDEHTDAKAFERVLAEDTALSSELDGLRDTLQLMRTLEAEEPPDHLDHLIMTHARQAADQMVEASGQTYWERLRFWLFNPTGGLVGMGLTAALIGLVYIPTMTMESPEAPVAMAPALEVAAEPSIEPVQDVADSVALDLRETSGDEGGRSFAEKEAPPAPKPAPRPKKRARRTRTAQTLRAKTAPAPVPATPPAPMAKAEQQLDSPASQMGASAGVPAQQPSGFELQSAERLAAEMIRAADTERARGNENGARRTLLRGLQRLQNAPARGDLMLRLAAWAYEAAQFEDAERWATQAANVQGFARRPEAAALAQAARAAMSPAEPPQ